MCSRLRVAEVKLGNYFELNIKVFVQGLFGIRYGRSKEMVKRLIGDVFLRPPNRHHACLDLDGSISGEPRKAALENLFQEFVVPTTNDALSRAGLVSLSAQGRAYMLPAVRRELASP